MRTMTLIQTRSERRVIPGLMVVIYFLVGLGFAVGAASAVHSERPGASACK